MNKMKKVFKVAIYELKLMCFSSKFLILSVLAFIIMDVTVRGYRMFSHDYNLPIAPAVLPFYFADVSYGNIEILFLLLWFSDVPMKQRVQNQILQRCGMPCFALGHLFSIVFATIVFVFEQFVFSVLLCGTNLTFTSWGKVWGSAAAGTVKKLGYCNIKKCISKLYGTAGIAVFYDDIFTDGDMLWNGRVSAERSAERKTWNSGIVGMERCVDIFKDEHNRFYTLVYEICTTGLV